MDDCTGQSGKSGYNLHPAAADCSLHLGAVPRRTDLPLGQQPPSKVPVGFGAYTALTPAAQAGACLYHSFMNGIHILS